MSDAGAAKGSESPEDLGTVTVLDCARARFRAWSVYRPGKWSYGVGRIGDVLTPGGQSRWYLVIECKFHYNPVRLRANGCFYTLKAPAVSYLMAPWDNLGAPLTTPYIGVRPLPVDPPFEHVKWSLHLPPRLETPCNKCCLFCCVDAEPLNYIAGCGHGFHVACVARHTNEGLSPTTCPECGFGIEDVIASS